MNNKIIFTDELEDIYKKRIKAIHGDKISFTNIVTKKHKEKAKVKRIFICNIHNCEFETTINSLLYKVSITGKRSFNCLKCRGENASKNFNHGLKGYLKKLPQEVLNKNNYSKAVYRNIKKNLTNIYCKEHKIFFDINPEAHKNGQMCELCQQEKTRLLYQKRFIDDMIKIDGDRTNYSKVNYIDKDTPITLICKLHKVEYDVKPSYHRDGINRCPECDSGWRSYDTEEWKKRILERHKERFNFNFPKFINTDVIIESKCNKCGEKVSLPAEVYVNSKNGCSRCRQVERSTKSLIKRSKEKFGDQFAFDGVSIYDLKEETTITCKKHGAIKVTGQYHLHSQGRCGCYKCNDEKKIEDKRQKQEKKFFEKSKQKFPNQFEYNKVKYVLNTTEVELYCKKHKIYFPVAPINHISSKSGSCPKCRYEYKLTYREFLNVSKEKNQDINGNQYEYLDEYKDTDNLIRDDKAKIKCTAHNYIFYQSFKNHLKGIGCKKCGYEIGARKQKKSKKQFIKESEKIYGKNKFIYEKVPDKVGNSDEVILGCTVKDHPDFLATARSHIHKTTGCPVCKPSPFYTQETFINKIKEVHGEYYDYSMSKFTSYNEKFTYKCPKHGLIKHQLCGYHVEGSGCPKCNRSKMEVRISILLYKNKIEHITQYKIKPKNRWLWPDFYFELDDKKIILEYDGPQHFVPIPFLGKDAVQENISKFIQGIKRDNDKQEWYLNQKDKSLFFIRIPFWEEKLATVIKGITIDKKLKFYEDKYNLDSNRSYFLSNKEELIKEIRQFKKYLSKHFNTDELDNIYKQ